MKQKRATAKKGTELVEYKEHLTTQIEEQEEKIKMIEKEVTKPATKYRSLHESIIPFSSLLNEFKDLGFIA